ncbi:MAG: phospholipase D family protein [Planctomycetota bacterium]
MRIPFLVCNEPPRTVARLLARLAAHSDEIRAAVAFVSDDELIRSWLKKGLLVRLLVALQPPTDPYVLRRLLGSWPATLEIKFYPPGFHSKVVIFLDHGQPVFAQVGSSNFTGGGLFSNLETNVLLQSTRQVQPVLGQFQQAWQRAAVLSPDDLDKYQAYFEATKRQRREIAAVQVRFERKALVPRLRRVRPDRVVKEAKDYLAFWKTVDEVIGIVKPVSRREWPKVPVYLTVDHFWHWLVTIWDKQGITAIRSSTETRKKMLPRLFLQYARWDRSHDDYTRTDMKKNSDYLRCLLQTQKIRTLTKTQAREVYRGLHSGRLRSVRFSADRTFASNNALAQIRKALGYLLEPTGDVEKRISALLPGGRYHLVEFGPSAIQELLGWVSPERMPLRNDKADKALEMLGYRFR